MIEGAPLFVAGMFGMGRPKRAKPLVLHVDDSHFILVSTKAMLESIGCDVVVAYGGKEGLELAGKQKPDLILVDTNMPEMDGYAVVRALRAGPSRETPIVMLTGVDVVKEVERAHEAGANSYLVKPVQLDRLRSKLQEFIPLSS